MKEKTGADIKNAVLIGLGLLLVLAGLLPLMARRAGGGSRGTQSADEAPPRADGASPARHQALVRDDLRQAAPARPQPKARRPAAATPAGPYDPLKVIALPIDERGIGKLRLKRAGNSQWWDTGKAGATYEIDDEEWDSYELSKSHPSESKSCLNCHVKEELP